MPITLIGYRGAGKSSAAPLLAARLGWGFVDADREIERRAGKSIREIFAADGEPVFRSLEAGTIAELLERPQCVLATGGGAVLNPDTRKRMRDAGPVVWLQASLETIFDRIGEDLAPGGARPALTEHSPRREVALLLEQREPMYREAATLIVRTDGRDISDVVDEILRRTGAATGDSQ